MEARLLTREERSDAAVVSLVSFHERTDNLDELRANAQKNNDEDWGAFLDDGTLAARIINNHLTTYLDGHEIPTGGIGAVSTLPEYRNSGAIREIFRQLLPAAYRRGEVYSALYPFSQAFYRKFGYETVCHRNEYSMNPEYLSDYRFPGQVRQWKQGDDVTPLLELYHTFASRLNLSGVRNSESMMHHLPCNYYKDGRFVYVLSDKEKPVSYLVFRDQQPTLQVQDLAWSCPAGFRAILGFLARFSADYSNIHLILPESTELYTILHSSHAYSVGKTTSQDYMIRIINVKEALSCMRKASNCSFTVQVEDSFIPENCGIWKVDGDYVTKSVGNADLITDIQSLSQLVAGAIDFDTALLREGVTLCANEQVLRSAFVKKPIYMAEHF